MKTDTASKLMIAFAFSASAACAVSLIVEQNNYAKIKPQTVSADTAYCTYNESNRRFRIIDASSKKPLIERTMPSARSGKPALLTTWDAPVYASGVEYTVRPEAGTCFVGNFYTGTKLIYKLL